MAEMAVEGFHGPHVESLLQIWEEILFLKGFGFFQQHKQCLLSLEGTGDSSSSIML